MTDAAAKVVLDLNIREFQRNLFDLPKPERHQAVETLDKISRMTWGQVYSDKGLKWEKIVGGKRPDDAEAVYSLRLNRSRRAIAYRVGSVMRFLTIAPDHDATYGRK